MTRQAIEHAIEAAGIKAAVTRLSDLSGGCIHQVSRVDLDDGRTLVAKLTNASQRGLFEEEAVGLTALAETNTVLVPYALHTGEYDGRAVLLMTHVDPGPRDDGAYRRLGEELAAMHRTDVGQRYGFAHDNHLGTTPQPNTWHDDWVEFNRNCRLGHQLNLAKAGRAMSSDELKTVERVIDRLDQILPHRPFPSLLHGDLWAGNAMPGVDEDGSPRVAVIDPACSIGDGWADIAMMQLFGGFPASCFEAYSAQIHDHNEVDRRIAAYQLYHVLNHVNLFGRGYARQAVALAQQLAA